MNAVGRFFTVIALGSLFSVATILVLSPVLRGPVAVALGMALSVGSMKLVDDHLSNRPRAPWTAIAMGAVGGATAWATLALLVA